MRRTGTYSRSPRFIGQSSRVMPTYELDVNNVYVAPTSWVVPGSDTNVGSAGNPVASISLAAQMVANGGTIWVCGDEDHLYYPISAQTIPSTKSNLTVKAVPGCKPTICGDNIPIVVSGGFPDGYSTALLRIFAPGTTVDGINIKNSSDATILNFGGGDGIVIAADNVTVKNCEVANAYGAGISVIGSYSNGVVTYISNAYVYNCTIHGYAERQFNYTQAKSSSINWPPGLRAAYVKDVTIEQCTVYKGMGEGIGLRYAKQTSTGNRVIDCKVYDAYSVGIYLDNVEHVTVSGCEVYSTQDTKYYRGGVPSKGISFACENEAAGAFTNRYITLSDCYIHHIGTGLIYGSYEANLGIRDLLVTGCTFAYSKNSLIAWETSASSANNSITGNTFYKDPTAGTYWDGAVASASADMSSVSLHANNWSVQPPAQFQGTADVYDAALASPP